jgi:hypothetical protein
MNKLKLNHDYVVWYPYGREHAPFLSVITGKYSGIIFELDSSTICETIIEDTIDHRLTYTYNIKKVWDSINPMQYTGNNITLTPEDQLYISDLILSYLSTISTINTVK